MGEKTSAPSWIGPVAGAVILIGGYVAYEQWHERDQHEKSCASMKRAWMSSTDAMMAGANDVMGRAKSKSDILNPEITGPLAQNTALSGTLDAQCPGWVKKQYSQ
jgi:hypothetical protein